MKGLAIFAAIMIALWGMLVIDIKVVRTQTAPIGPVELMTPFDSSITKESFVIHYGLVNQSIVEQLSPRLEESIAALSELFVTEFLETIHVYVYPSLSWMRGLTTDANLPYAVNGKKEIHVIAPENAENKQGFIELTNTAIRQLTYSVARTVNANLDLVTTPKLNWLLEAIAVHLSGTEIDTDPLVESLRFTFVTLSDLDEEKVIKMGSVLIDFIVEDFGLEALRVMLDNNGDISQSLDISVDGFANAWLQYSSGR